ncbi:NF038122 family metalloprotease [Phenylobacterium sp.]|uniref:NF038122 family metalloprotease n=1 Tax=Phenylobacterium sp. TaxID=1871053 RepID=UPI002DEB5784|nr:NF038122 family metalloprotease [Phenylobacterium sp.]
MPVSSETVTAVGSGLVFQNTYEPGVTDGYRAAVLTAETYLQSHISNSVTIQVDWVFDAVDKDFAATNSFSAGVVGYSALKAALSAHASSSDDLLSVAGLPTLDPSGGARFIIPVAQAHALGFLTAPVDFDVQVTLGSGDVWSFGDDAVAAIVHELSEGAFGRVGSLGKGAGAPHWAPMDLFRFSLAGVRDYTGGADGIATYFGVDGAHVVPDLQFHNSVDPTGVSDHQDLADWDNTFDDAFGPGGGGSFNHVSNTDLQILDVLGWDLRTPDAPFTAGDDFASDPTDTSHPFGQLSLGVTAHGVLQGAGDRDVFAVAVGPGNYLISETGATGGGGTLSNPFLRVYDSADGVLVRQADDIIPGQNLDSRLVIHIGTATTLYVSAGSHLDAGSGSYSIDILQGAAASTTGNDMLFGDIGGSTITAGAGDDTVVGRDSQNYLRGEDGNDSIQGGAAFDDINGNVGNDTIHGGEGDDWVVGGKNDDVLFGDDGNDIVYGNLGNDTCVGGWGNDLIRGGQGDDSLSGGEGDDWLSGDRGNDTITGGAGADTFHTFNGAGLDVVTDFNSAEGDRVQLDPGTTFTLRQAGADTIIDLGAGDEMILRNVQLSTLPPGWIFGA